MIIDLPRTTASAVSKTLVRIRDEAGAVALGRVLTLIIVAGVIGKSIPPAAVGKPYTKQ